MAQKKEKKSVSKSNGRKRSKSSTSVNPKPRKVYQSKWREEKEKRGDYTNQKEVPYETIKELFSEFKELHLSDLDNPWTRNLTIRRFFLVRGYLPIVVCRWVNKYPELIDYQLAKYLIGDKREVGMMHRELSEKSTMWHMENYIEGWFDREERHRLEDKQHQKEMAKLRAQEAEGAANYLLQYFQNKQIELPELDDSKGKASSKD